MTDLKVGDIVLNNINMELVVQDTSHAAEGLYFGGYVADRFSWGEPAPKDYVRIDTVKELFRRKVGK